MYIPDHFSATASQAFSLMREHPFALILHNGADGVPAATHMPLLVRHHQGKTLIEGHFARANPHWKLLNSGLQMMAIFNGPHAYISPSWYPSKAATGKVVPTWNYATVHASGPARIISDEEPAVEFLARLTTASEQHRDQPWSIADAPPEYIKTMVRGIVVFEMTVELLEAKAKLNQNKTPEDIAGTITGLDGEATENARHIARMMRAMAAK